MEAAEEAGRRFADAFTLTLVRYRIGVELWPRRGGEMFMPTAPAVRQVRDFRRFPNNRLGLFVYETANMPRRGYLHAGRFGQTATQNDFIETFERLASSGVQLTDRARMSIDLFNASFFEPASDTRFLTLVMAVEALLEPSLRSREAVALVDSFIAATRTSGLPEAEQTSLRGTLKWLRQESIRSAARGLATRFLGNKLYDGRPAPKFFLDCYDLRSDLVHRGDIRNAREKAHMAASNLELFVSDLLLERFAG